ncbi:MAG: DNA repair protein, partial [Selenomonas sp.]|nr:DNA repair protein [Selenomonas sp.]
VEMADQLALNLTSRHVVTASVTMCIVYSSRPDFFLPPASGTIRLDTMTNASSVITDALKTLYARIVQTSHPIRRILLCANHVEPEARQELSLFAPPEAETQERARQQTTLALHQRFGKNALLRATDLLAAATRRERNEQIGGHKAYGDQETVEPRKNLPALRRAARAAGAPARKRTRA